MAEPHDDHKTLAEGAEAPPGTPPRSAETVQFLPPAGAAKPPSSAELPTLQSDVAALLSDEKTDAESSFSLDVPPELHKHPRYKITRFVGGGGMGLVFQAEHRMMDRPVALKVVHPKDLAHRASVERFRREVQAAARLHHPNIVAAFDADEAGATHFLVMEFVEGQTLAQYLKDKGKLDIAEACDIIRQAALGLEHAHQNRMVHRDIKPDNLMRTERGDIKILDFGLARFAQEEAAAEKTGTGIKAETAPAPATYPGRPESTGQLTGAGSVMGTPDYIAPEQIKDTRTADIRSDIYALGCTLYQLLTGQVLFPEGKVSEKLKRHVEEKPRALRQLRPDAPAGLAYILDRMLAKDPTQRYQTPAEVAAALAPFARADEPRRRRRRRLLLGALLLLVIGGAAGFLVYRERTNYGVLQADADLPDALLIVRRADEPDREFSRLRVSAGRGELDLPPGEYLLALGDGFPGLRLVRDHVTITRGQVTSIALVRIKPEEPAWPVYPVPDAGALAARASPLDPFPAIPVPEHLGEANLKPPVELVGILGGSRYRLSGPSTAPSFSADGALAAIGSGDDVLVFETGTGRVRHVFRGHSQPVDAVALSPDGQWLASAGRDLSVRLWSLPKNVEVRNWFAAANAVAFSSDSSVLAFSQSPRLYLHQVHEDKTEEVPLVSQAVSLSFQPKGDWLAIGQASGAVRLYHRRLKTYFPDPPLLEKAHTKAVVAFSPDGFHLAIAGASETSLWHTPMPGDATTRKAWHADVAGDALLGFEQGGSLFVAKLASAKLANPFSATQLDFKTGKRLGATLLAPWTAPGLFTQSPDGRWLAGYVGYDGRTLFVHDVKDRLPQTGLDGHLAPVVSLAFLPDGQHLVSVGADRKLLVWNLADQSVAQSFATLASPEGLAVSPDGARLAVPCGDLAIRFWHPKEGLKKTLRLPFAALRTSFDPKGKTVFVSGKDGKILSFDADTGADRVAFATTTSDVEGLTLDHSGKALAAAGAKGQIHVWEADTGRQLGLFTGHSTDVAPEPTGVHFLLGSPDNRLLLSTGRDGSVRVWDWEKGARLHVLHGLSGEGRRLAISPDARFLAAGGSDGQILLWDLSPLPPGGGGAEGGGDGPRRLTLREPQKFKDSPIGALAFSAEGRYLAAGLSDGTIQMYRLSKPGEPVTLPAARASIRLEALLPGRDDRIDFRILPDGERMIAIHKDGSLRISDIRTGKDLSVRDSKAPPTRLAVADDGKTAFTIHALLKVGPPRLKIWDLTAVTPAKERLLVAPVLALNGKGEVIIARKKWTPILLDAAGVDKLKLPSGAEHSAVELSPDGRWALVAGDKETWLINLQDGLSHAETPNDAGPFTRLAFSADSKRAAWPTEQSLLIYDLDADREIGRFPIPPGIQLLAFTPDKRYLLVALLEGQALLYDLSNGERVDSFRTVPMSHARFTPDGRFLVTTHLVGEARLWRMPK
ncbi:MAG: protein kinase [Gemmataceae bacterium]